MKIGFIGLGNMGAPMAANLAKAGHDVTGFDMAQVRIDGVRMAESATAAAKGAEVVITMLPNGAILRAVADQVIPAMDKGAVLLDCSTVDVESARDVATQAQAAGLLALDAPVSGGVGGAEGAALTFMAGGSADAFGKARPVLEKMGKRIIHSGDAGAGQVAKLCNNMVLAIAMIGTSEAMTMGQKLGLSPQVLFDVMSTSSGSTWALTHHCPVPGPVPGSAANNDYKPGFAADLMLKDLTLAQDAARTAGTPTPLGASAMQLYRLFIAQGHGAKDYAAIIKMIGGEK